VRIAILILMDSICALNGASSQRPFLVGDLFYQSISLVYSHYVILAVQNVIFRHYLAIALCVIPLVRVRIECNALPFFEGVFDSLSRAARVSALYFV